MGLQVGRLYLTLHGPRHPRRTPVEDRYNDHGDSDSDSRRVDISPPIFEMSVRKVLESQPFLIAATTLSGILSIVVIGLVADNLQYVHSGSAKNGFSTIGFNLTVNDTLSYNTATVAHLPVDLRTGSYWLMLAAGIGGFIDAILLGGTLCWRRLKSASLQVEHGEVSRHFRSCVLLEGSSSALLDFEPRIRRRRSLTWLTTDIRPQSKTANPDRHLPLHLLLLHLASSRHLRLPRMGRIRHLHTRRIPATRRREPLRTRLLHTRRLELPVRGLHTQEERERERAESVHRRHGVADGDVSHCGAQRFRAVWRCVSRVQAAAECAALRAV